MSFSITSIEHAIASAAQHIVHEAQTIANVVIPALKKVQAAQPTIDAVLNTINPQAATIERASFFVLGRVLAAVTDGQAAVTAGGLNLQLNAQELADLKALAASLKPAPAPTP